MYFNAYPELLPVNSSHGHLVTRSTCHRSTRHAFTHASRHKITCYKRAHNTATSRKIFYLHSGHVAPRNSPINSAQHGWRSYRKRAYNKTCTMLCSLVWLSGFSVWLCAISQLLTMAKLLNATKARSKVRSTRHNAVRHDGQLVTRFLRCDELTVWRVDWLPVDTLLNTGSLYRALLYKFWPHQDVHMILQLTWRESVIDLYVKWVDCSVII